MTNDEAGALVCAMLEKAGGRMELSEQDMLDGLAAMRTRLRVQTSSSGVRMWLEPLAPAALTEEPPR